MPTKTVPRYILTIDWEDTGERIPYDHPTAIEPKNMDYAHGANLLDVFSMVGLRGNATVDDPESRYDPLSFLDDAEERERLTSPHRFWIYQLDTNPPDPTPRNTGWALVDRRPDRYTARIRLASLTFEELQTEVVIPSFNSTQVPGDPTIPPPSFVRESPNPRVTEIDGPTFNDAATEMTFTILTANTVSGQTVYYDFIGAGAPPAGGEAILAPQIQATVTVPVTANTRFAIIADVEEGLPGFVGITVTVPDPTELEATASDS